VATTLKSASGQCATAFTEAGVDASDDNSGAVYLGPCDGRIGQRWSWNPDVGVLQNDVHTVLAVPRNAFVQENTLLTTAEPWGDATQQWRRRPDAFQK
jgi:hypothetical protein